MNIWEKIKYGLWPAVKMKLKIWWYSLRYGGKDNIPPEVLFGEMEDSMERLQENLMNALRDMPDDISDEDQAQLLEALQKAKDLDTGLDAVQQEAEKKRKDQKTNEQKD